MRRGEFLGLAGLVCGGRSELAVTVFGIARPLGGEVVIDGQPIKVHSPRDAINHGIYLVPEDRRKTGLITNMAVRENVTLAALSRYSSLGLISFRRESETAEAQRKKLSIKTATCETLAQNLSGGNQPKGAFAKRLSLQPKLIIFLGTPRHGGGGDTARIYPHTAG